MISAKKMAISFPLSLVAIFFSFRVVAYTYTSDYSKGVYWKQFPVTMTRFATNNTDANNLQNLVNQAVEEWENSIGQNLWDIRDVVLSSSYTGNYIKWSENFGAETGFDPNSTLAVTVRYNKGTFFESVVIILNGSISYLRQNWGNTLRTTILHELGHTMGLDHSTVTNSIMYPSLASVSSLQSDDIAGMIALVNDTKYKQQTGYISPYATNDESKSLIPACGTVEEVNKNNDQNGSKQGTQFLLTVLIGFLMGKILTTKKRNYFLVKN